jgi:hypothetical protein
MQNGFRLFRSVPYLAEGRSDFFRIDLVAKQNRDATLKVVLEHRASSQVDVDIGDQQFFAF